MDENVNNQDFLQSETPRANFYGYTCIGGRPEDQDCMAYDEASGRQVWVVCDGMGGHAGGCVASRTAVETLTSTFRKQPEDLSVKDAIVTAVTDANRAVFDRSQEEPSLRGMGTTLTMLVIDGQAAYVTHIGDSRVYQLRKGRKVFRTHDHSMVFELVDKKQITEEEARVHPRSNILSRALGILPDVDVEVKRLEYRAGDRFVLCCDGVWNAQPEPQLLEMLSTGTPEETANTTKATTERLGQEGGGQHDNHTMIVVDLKERSRYRKSIFKRLFSHK